MLAVLLLMSNAAVKSAHATEMKWTRSGAPMDGIQAWVGSISGTGMPGEGDHVYVKFTNGTALTKRVPFTVLWGCAVGDGQITNDEALVPPAGRMGTEMVFHYQGCAADGREGPPHDVAVAMGSIQSLDNGQGVFEIRVLRKPAEEASIRSTIYVNNQSIGEGLENRDVAIPAGVYSGVLRYVSEKHAQGPFGSVAKRGDFLLEVAGVRERSNILFHGGTMPAHSRGCILLGAVTRKAGGAQTADDTTLRRLRMKFYGTDVPDATPAVNVRIVIAEE